MEHKKCRQTFAVQHRGDTFNALNCGFAVDFSGARPRHWKSECLSTQSPRVFSVRSSGNSCASTHSQRTARHDASSANTSTSFSTQSRGIQPKDISARLSFNFVGNHVNSRESQPVHEMRARSSRLRTQADAKERHSLICCGQSHRRIAPLREPAWSVRHPT